METSGGVEQQPPPTEGRCGWCSKPCRPRRCTRCHNTSFCSRECQRADWNDREKGHRNACDAAYAAAAAAHGGATNGVTGRSPTEVAAAEAELRQLLYGPLAAMSLDTVQGDFYKAMDEVERIKKEEMQQAEATELKEVLQVVPVESSSTEKIETDERSTAQFSPKEKQQIVQQPTKPKQELPTIFDKIGQQWQCLVERLPHVSCYSITLTRNKEANGYASLSDRLRIRIGADSRGSTESAIVRLYALGHEADDNAEVIVALNLPGQIQSDVAGMRLSVDEINGLISVRLPYGEKESSHSASDNSSSGERWANTEDGDDIFVDQSCFSNPTDVATLGCRSCGYRLLTKDANISNILPLPFGCWDEVADYLTCYEGQPAFDFGSKSTVADRGMILEDGSVLVLNRGDLGRNVCVLAIDGYGEPEEEINGNGDNEKISVDNDESRGLSPSGLADLDAIKNGAEFRGLRKWRDSVGGATLCCSQCCSTLGFASLENPDACRLFKHRLSSLGRRQSKGSTRDIFSRNTCASFLAKDMVRYAESQAVFTFVVTGRADGVAKSRAQSCILLKLLSWDTVIATSVGEGEEHVSTPLTKGAKVIFEFIEDFTDEMNSSGTKAESINDIMSWTWGGADLCCPPFASGDATNHKQQQQQEDASVIPDYGKASVQIFLTEEEMAQVRKELLAFSSLFSESVSKATLMLKLGNDGKKGPEDIKGLSVIPILS